MLELKNIKKIYPVGVGAVNALKGINLKFRESEFVSILGPSGSGKTTLLNILGMPDNRFEGEIKINDAVISKKIDNHQFRNKNIGFIFQSYYLIDYLTVEENIKMPMEYSAGERVLSEEYFEELVEKLHISHLLKENVNYLSGGEKQRVAIARAFINNPNIIICDEPTGNLDEVNSLNVIGILKQFISDDKVIIIVTHDSSLADHCDIVLELKEGKLYEKE